MESQSYSLMIFNSADETWYSEQVKKSEERNITVAQLLETLNERFMAWDGRLLGADSYVKLQPEWTMGYIRRLGSFVYNPVLASPDTWNLCKSTKQREKVKIRLKSKSNNPDILELETFQITSGFELYKQIKNVMRLDQDQMCKLSIDELDIEPMGVYVLANGEIVYLHMILSGSNSSCMKQFVDMTNTSGVRILKWSDSAPAWRLSNPGLSVEGKCQTSECEAHSNYVIINKKLGSYDIQMDDHTNRCPLCNQYVKAEKIAFNNCVYSFKGVIFKGDGNAPQKVCKENVIVGDHYQMFDPKNVGQVDWISLIFDVYDSSWGLVQEYIEAL